MSNQLEVFVNRLRKYDLLEAAAWRELEGSSLLHGDDFQPLMKHLVAVGRLTMYQVKLIAQGQARELIAGPYVILDKLGEGGMGQVFKARHRTMNRLVALKLMKPDLMSDSETVKRFQREVEMAAQLVHPNIAVAFDAGEADGRHYLAMEYIEGIDAYRYVRERGPLPIDEASEMIRQTARGLQFAHERGVVHRDIKPANLLVVRLPDGRPHMKILDMGLARPLGKNAMIGLTATGAVLGTPDYIAPEQASDSKRVDGRADLYSLGCTFFFLLTGRKPYSGETAIEVVLHHQMNPPPDIMPYRHDIPDGLKSILLRLMAKKPEDRFQTAAELIDALEPYCPSNSSAPTGIQPSVAREGLRNPESGRHFLLDKHGKANVEEATHSPNHLPQPKSIVIHEPTPKWVFLVVGMLLTVIVMLVIVLLQKN